MLFKVFQAAFKRCKRTSARYGAFHEDGYPIAHHLTYAVVGVGGQIVFLHDIIYASGKVSQSV